MRKILLLLAIGVAIGYWWGFKDAKVNEHDIVSRLVSRAGGATRGNVTNNTDRLMDSLETH